MEELKKTHNTRTIFADRLQSEYSYLFKLSDHLRYIGNYIGFDRLINKLAQIGIHKLQFESLLMSELAWRHNICDEIRTHIAELSPWFKPNPDEYSVRFVNINMENIREALIVARITQFMNCSMLAAALGIDKTYVSKIESGCKKVTVNILSKYLSGLEMRLSMVI